DGVDDVLREGHVAEMRAEAVGAQEQHDRAQHAGDHRRIETEPAQDAGVPARAPSRRRAPGEPDAGFEYEEREHHDQHDEVQMLGPDELDRGHEDRRETEPIHDVLQAEVVVVRPAVGEARHVEDGDDDRRGRDQRAERRGGLEDLARSHGRVYVNFRTRTSASRYLAQLHFGPPKKMYVPQLPVMLWTSAV